MTRRTRRTSGRVTLDDVARRVGVSKITISRALREPWRVSEGLRQRIDAAIDELGYIPNRQAGALASARSRSIALLVPSLSNAVFSEVIRGVDEGFVGSGYQVLLGHTSYSREEEAHLIDTYLSFGVDGFIISGSQHTESARQRLARAGLPICEIMELPEAPLDMAVGFDHEAAGHALTTALLELGYRQLGFIGARMDYRARRRFAGWQRALNEAGLSADACLTTEAPSDYRLGGCLLGTLLERHSGLEMVCCGNDDLAAGALFECQRRGITVPDQLGLTGYNGLDITEATTPTLSTVVTPRRRIGIAAATQMLSRLENGRVTQPLQDLGFEIALRESTRARGE
ncbi:LacI family DNA-binding transcriptional regulator [Kushneria phosphatilytica]|uniref:LacI family DNA-binding transcriptional regulator n=1 Tax=Kushneria phosphatilytica TaxID=657387 RepID=A0A1S1P350_9GAMM|nr:LacI family DNA-binding transcriptional regulator [Kushneria phosphatilytica]OHV13829.1 LacI family transcriptional regulator [Kushneria phosphatilytica]QEL10384.1 LacI family DNA-binding transcriptional regulator [Kushneria phosphatilytica]